MALGTLVTSGKLEFFFESERSLFPGRFFDDANDLSNVIRVSFPNTPESKLFVPVSCLYYFIVYIIYIKQVSLRL